MTTAETTHYRDGKIVIFYDEGGFNPREDQENLARLILQPDSRRIDLNEIDFPFGDEDYDWSEDNPTGRKEGEGLGTWATRIMTEQLDVLYIANLYRYEHSGVAYSVRDFNDQWDSGQVGWAVVTKKSAEICGTPPDLFAEVVKSEVEEFSAWANGEVYGFHAVAPDGRVLETLGGYLGYDSFDEMKAEARPYIDDWHEDQERRREDQAADAIAELELIHG